MGSRSFAGLLALLVFCLPTAALGQTLTYTFDGSDGGAWPGEIATGGEYETPDEVYIYSGLNQPLFINDGYGDIAGGNLFTQNGAALWGQPTFSGTINFVLPTPMHHVAFDFTWGKPFDSLSDELVLDLFDGDGNSFGTHSIFLNDSFSSGDYNGWEGHVAFDATTLSVPGGISGFEINLGFDTGFAIDNLSFSATPAGTPNTGSSLKMTYNGGTQEFSDGSGASMGVLQYSDGGVYSFPNDEVTNDGTEATTYSLLYTGDVHRPGGVFVENIPIDPGQTLPVGSLIGQVSTNQLSGQYQGQVILVNDLNPDDPNKTFNVTYHVFAPAIITANNGDAISPSGDNEVTIANADVEAHEGALRAASRIVSQSISDGFFVDGIHVNDIIEPGAQLQGTIGFDPTGKIAGTYNGVYSVDLKMIASEGVFGPGVSNLNGTAFLPDTFNWFLTETVTAQMLVSQDVEAGQNFGQAAIGIRNESTAVELVDGFSSSEVSVQATFVPNPQTQAALLGSAIELNLSDIVDYYVMQITYLDADLPNGFDELDLRVHVYDPNTDAWVEAILLNSDGGTGALFFEGSYDAYLASIVGTPGLSVYGVDATNNHVWAVLDHNSIFGIVVVPEPASLALLAFGAAMMLRRRNRA